VQTCKSVLVIVSVLTFIGTVAEAVGIKVSGGEDHTLVLSANKCPWGCGYNGWYQLGIGNNQDQKTLARVHGGDTGRTYLQDINNIAAGWKHSLALDANGFVWAWGWNEKGQLGDGTTRERTSPVQVHGVDDVGYLRHIIAISAGRSGRHSLAVDANNFVYGWGYNKYGQCGNDHHDCNEFTPVRVLKGEQNTSASGYLENIVSVSGGQTHSMALEKLDPNDPNCNGRVYTFGSNWWPADYEVYPPYPPGYGKLGNGDEQSNYIDTPVRVLKGEQDTSTSNYLENIVAVSAGWDHCMALEKYDHLNPNYKGRVYTWGNNGFGWGNFPHQPSVGGRLGDGTTDSNSTPVVVLSGEQDPNNPNSYLKGIVAIAAGEGHSMALDVNGFVYCWGDNLFGQLGNGTNDLYSTTPVKVVGPDLNHNGIHEPNEGYLENIVAISAGFWHCIAVDEDGTIWTWGKGEFGRLGIGTIDDKNIPQRLPVVYNITRVPVVSYFRIQSAIDDANNAGDILVASLGTFYQTQTVDFLEKAITLRSTDPQNPSIVAGTIIDGSNQNSDPITLDNNPGSTIAGFTITNSHQSGLACTQSSVSIENCIIRNNQDTGICLSDSIADITNCRIQDNIVYGIICNPSEAVITNSTFDGNDITSSAICATNLSDVKLANCTVKKHTSYGIYVYDSNIEINHSVIERNSSSGLYCSSGSTLNLINSVIRFNGNHGICLDETLSATIKNNWIHNNGADDYDYGIYISDEYGSAPAIIRNNTIVNNSGYGIYRYYYTTPDPNISNCIIWDNKTPQLYSDWGNFENVRYSCISGGWGGNGNIDDDPNFMNSTDPNDLHINGLPCKNAGDPAFVPDSGETDIDGEGRVKYGHVDIGADEYYWSPADFDEDEIVNFFDYAIFANAWDSNNSNSNWNPDCNIGTPVNNRIDYNDLAVFCEDWLWQAGWAKTFTCGAGQGMGQTMGQSMSQTMTPALVPAIGAAAEAPYKSVSAELQIEKVEPVKIEELIDWLDGIWLEGELKEVMTEAEYLEFRKAIEESPR
jgi:alpha-tubulin suppressor-like RCC1 family protein